MKQYHAELLARPLAWNENSLKVLATWAESEILKPSGLTFNSYSTARAIFRNPKKKTIWIWKKPVLPGLYFGLEELPPDPDSLASVHGVALKKTEELKKNEVLSTLRSACDLIANISPALFLSLRYLLRSLHIIDHPGHGIDISFSLPDLPNSIFISIPDSGEKDAVPRLAEAIVHEVLHLQLTLVEKAYPIIRTDVETMYIYSPWRNELRPETGIVHALFVFRGLETLWSEIGLDHPVCFFRYADERVKNILDQISFLELQNFRTLTPFGYAIVAGLIDGKK